jgi:hypothetical protein
LEDRPDARIDVIAAARAGEGAPPGDPVERRLRAARTADMAHAKALLHDMLETGCLVGKSAEELSDGKSVRRHWSRRLENTPARL